ncbi:ImmA/IrrE family metallo-endopeptidase [Oceanivirga miroungae]|uniref:IrrE N-terminal-like domain-containing protein n=1 Tax=Oceanivirga miroungae TaxID=1130046 RepID=A0A6I8M4V8_9FUSO|nr:ImmA/IrrE family metallo-endopeptidase [Oceanivirga miroungae]VWL84945.1 hypothetical protein OMES3154_00218 [Oceanivirga miroungae]
MTKKQIDNLIDKLIIENGTVNPIDIIKRNNIQVIYHFDSFKGVCVKIPGDCTYISIRENLDTLDKFFTLAHELYHALIDFKNDYPYQIKPFSQESCVSETRANYFAYKLLLKQDENILEDFYNENPNIEKNIEKIINNLANRGL